MTDILYSDNDICVCKKPRGVLSEGDGKESLPTILGEALKTKVFPVHRLDRETEGIMVYALSSRAASELSRQITEGNMKKEYIATLCGCPEKDADKLCDLLFYDRQRGKTFVVKRERRGVKSAELDYKIVSRDGDYTTVRVRLITGRTHQIRAQFASRGLPLRGDRRYGAPKEDGTELSLRACYLGFFHPVSGDFMEFGEKDNW